MLYVEVIIYQFCEYLFCIYILLCTCDDTRGTLCNNQWVMYVCMYICNSTRTSFLIIFCVSYNVCEYMCVLCFNFIYAKVYFVCHTMSVYICVCVLCFSFHCSHVRVYVYMLKHYEKVLYIICHACACLYIYICVCIYIFVD